MWLHTATRKSGGDSADDRAFGVAFGHAHDEPAEFSDIVMSSDALVELLRVGPVVVAFVLGRHLDVLPDHIEFCNECAELVVDGYLRCRPWEPVSHENQAEPRLARRFRTCVDEFKSFARLWDTVAAAIPCG